MGGGRPWIIICKLSWIDRWCTQIYSHSWKVRYWKMGPKIIKAASIWKMGQICKWLNENCSPVYEECYLICPSVATDANWRSLCSQCHPRNSYCYLILIHHSPYCYKKLDSSMHFNLLCRDGRIERIRCHEHDRLGTWINWIIGSGRQYWSLCRLHCPFSCRLHPLKRNRKSWQDEISLQTNGCQYLEWCHYHNGLRNSSDHLPIYILQEIWSIHCDDNHLRISYRLSHLWSHHPCSWSIKGCGWFLEEEAYWEWLSRKLITRTRLIKL